MATTTVLPTKGSASTSGRGIKITTSASPGDTIHAYQAGTTAGNFDVVDVTVYNSDTVDRTITFQDGGTTSPDDSRGGTVPAGEERTFYNFMGQNGLLLKAFGSAANVLSAHVRVRNVVTA